MEIQYKTKKLKKECTIFTEAVKSYGHEMAIKINQRIKELKANETVEYLIKYSIGRCHPLKGNRNGQYAMDLIHPYRLIFTKIENKIEIVKIIEITDYH